MSSLLPVIVKLLPFIQIGLSVILIALILLQRSDADVGGSFGGDGSGGTKFIRRGLEKGIYNLSIIFGILFVASCLIALVLR